MTGTAGGSSPDARLFTKEETGLKQEYFYTSTEVLLIFILPPFAKECPVMNFTTIVPRTAQLKLDIILRTEGV